MLNEICKGILNMKNYKFSNESGKEFSATLRQRVNAYFKENGLSKHANTQMVVKSVIALSLYLIPFAIMLIFAIGFIPLLFALWVVMGFGKMIIGTSVMHDALHGSYSGNRQINKLMSFSAAVVGIDGDIWKIQHNVLHHTYTNIEHADEDIQPRFVMRFTPNQPRRWFHRYQYIYAPFFYGISTLVWVIFKDYNKIFQYKRLGMINKGKPFRKHLTKMIFRKILYYICFIGLPILILPVPFWVTFLLFMSMHLVTGSLLSLIFQSAHIMPNAEFINQNEAQIQQSWIVHQLRTTTNFGMGNKFLSWCIGGLNFQVEHHLFPDICHVHYPKIAPIVQEVTREFALPYYAEKSFGAAINSHFSMLKMLGRS